MDETEQTFTLEPDDNRRLAALCGTHDENLHYLEHALSIHIANRGNTFTLKGKSKTVTVVVALLHKLYQNLMVDSILTPAMLHLEVTDILNNYAQSPSLTHEETTLLSEPPLALTESSVQLKSSKTQDTVTVDPQASSAQHYQSEAIQTKHKLIQPRGYNQHQYVRHIQHIDLNFGVGPAGTGKTYLAVACAAQALESGRVRRIILVRPAVEAGERLGFLPGDFAQKVDPYLRPLYDALFEIMGLERVGKLLERNIIEIAPLAYMRGRTLNDAFIILDESQNTTREQMKMFLTRLGFGSIAVVTGDLTQIDLPKGIASGLSHALAVLGDLKGISVTHFGSQDVVRHPLVQRIVDAYAIAEQKIEVKR